MDNRRRDGARLRNERRDGGVPDRCRHASGCRPSCPGSANRSVQHGCARVHPAAASLIGVDRLDYSKGLVRRLAGVERLLERQPHYRRAIVMLQIASPTCVRRSQNTRISAPNSTLAWAASMDRFWRTGHAAGALTSIAGSAQETLFGFYRGEPSGAGHTTARRHEPRRQGICGASQDANDPGILVLVALCRRGSGVGRSTHRQSLIDVDEVSVALDRALAMTVEERCERHGTLMNRLAEYDIHAWFKSVSRRFTEAAQDR